MTMNAKAEDAVGNHASPAQNQRRHRRFGIGLAFFALLDAFAGSAWADTLSFTSGAGQSGLIGTSSAQPVVVQLRNVNGGVIAGRSISWSTGNGFLLSAPSSVTDANGQASVTFTYGNYGTTTIIASDPSTGLNASAPETSAGSDSIVLISGGGQVGQAGTTAAQPIVVELRNAAGVPVVGRTVNWSDQTTYTQVNAATSSTNGSGQASMGFSFVEGPPVLGGSPAGITATNSIGGQSVTATQTELGANILTITSPPQVTGLVGQTSPPVVAHVADWQGNPIAGATVTWTGNASIFILSNASTVTDASGNTSITAQYIGSTGDDILTAAYNGTSADVHFYLASQTYIAVLSANPAIGPPNTASTTPLAIQDFNKDGTPRAGDTITWTVQSGDSVLNGPTSITDASGIATMGFTFGSASTFTQFLATDSRGVSRGLGAVPSGSQALLNVSGAGQVGSSLSAAASPIVMQVVDQAGTPQSGVTVTWDKYANGTFGFNGDVTFTSSTTSVSDVNGLVQVTFDYGAIGKIAIRGVLPAGTGNGATVTSFGTETLTLTSGDRQSGLVGTHSAQPVVVTFRDQSGAALVGQTINWAVLAGGNAVLDAATSVTNGSGQASIGFTYGATASASEIEASATSSNPFVGPIVVQALVTGVGADSLSVISGNGQSGPESSVGAQPLVVEVRDAAGALVAGRTINWATSAGDATPNAVSSVTNGAGRASVAFTYGLNFTVSTLTATDASNGHVVNFSVTSTSVSNHALIVSGNGQSGLPGSAGAQPIVVELRDASNVPQPGQNVAWRVVSGPATLGATTLVTDANGQVSAAFNYGATPGTSIIEAYDSSDPINGQRVQATVTSLGSNQALSIVSGDSQTLVANTPSAPMVVLLKDVFNAPVVGATINWSASAGTLANPTSVTDASGQASNTVTPTANGAVSVTASSTLAASAVSFSLSSGLATLPNLTPQQQVVAVAVDNACPALAQLSTLSSEQADLLARCQEITAAAALSPTATAGALEELLTKTAETQATAATVAVGAQIQNINARLINLRSGAHGVSTKGLTFTGAGGSIPLLSLMQTLTDVDAPQAGDSFDRWGFFASGNIGRGEANANASTPAYDYDIDGITVGIDYRKRDDWVFGAALGYSRQDTTLAAHQGDAAMNGWSLSAYSTYSFKELWYLDSVLIVGHNSFDMNRNIHYTLPTVGGGSTSIDQVANGQPGGGLFSTALTFGGDFHNKAWGFSPYGQMIYSRMSFDAYQETLQAGPGNGLGLAVDARTITSLTGILGARLSFTRSANWGVFAPIASLELDHEFKSDQKAITARFIFDPTHTPFSVSGAPIDSSYVRLGLGMTMVFTHGKSGFILFQHMLARTGQSQDNLSLGLRIEF